MVGDHLVYTSKALGKEIWVFHLLLAESSCVSLLPYHKSHFVAKIEEKLVVRIVTGSDAVRACVLHESKIAHHRLKWNRTAERVVVLVTVEAEKKQWLAVQKKFFAIRLYLTEADSVDQIVDGFSFLAKLCRKGIKLRDLSVNLSV